MLSGVVFFNMFFIKWCVHKHNNKKMVGMPNPEHRLCFCSQFIDCLLFSIYIYMEISYGGLFVLWRVVVVVVVVVVVFLYLIIYIYISFVHVSLVLVILYFLVFVISITKTPASI